MTATIREAVDLVNGLAGVEAALYAVKYTEALANGAGPSVAVRAAAAHVLDHRMELEALQATLDERAARKDRR